MSSTKITIRPLSTAIGAEISGIDLAASLGNEAFDTVHDAFVRYSVLVFRDQNLNPDAQVALSRRFGPPEAHVLQRYALPENPDVFVVSNRMEDGKPKGAIRAGQFWHSDLSYMARPTYMSMLHALEVPSQGGDTMYASTTAAFDALSPIMQEFLTGLTAVHDYILAYEKVFWRFPERPALTVEEHAQLPAVEHPVVRLVPETGRRSIYVDAGFTRRIVGMENAESDALLDFLFSHISQPEFVYRHAWRPGDVVMWDNRSTQHKAVADYDMAEVRHMHRVSTQGDPPISG